MAKRKSRHPKLPNGFGSIKKLSGNRTNPYAVHPPTTEFAPNGSPLTPKALCYVDDWYKGFYILLALKNGVFSEKTIGEVNKANIKDSDKNYDIVSKIIAAYNVASLPSKDTKTFSEVYAEFYAYKYSKDTSKKLSKASQYSTQSAFKNCSVLHDKYFNSLRLQDLQKVVDDCPLKHASKELIVNLFRQMYNYALMMDLCEKDYSSFVRINTPDDDEKGIPFSEAEIDLIWDKKDTDPVLQCILIMIYSGFRIAEYSHKSFTIDSSEGYFQGGLKTKSGKGRIVPIHHMIADYVTDNTVLFQCRPDHFRVMFTDSLSKIGISGHTPHDTRHTFSWLCDKYHVDSLSKKLMLGHSLGNSVTDSVYGHRTYSELKTEINKIKHW